MAEPSTPPPENKFRQMMEKLRQEAPSSFWFLYRFELICGLLMLIGIITSFFHRQVGGAFVGFSLGFGFYSKIKAFLMTILDYIAVEGLFPPLMLMGTALFLLITLPTFIVFLILGFGVRLLVRNLPKRLS